MSMLSKVPTFVSQAFSMVFLVTILPFGSIYVSWENMCIIHTHTFPAWITQHSVFSTILMLLHIDHVHLYGASEEFKKWPIKIDVEFKPASSAFRVIRFGSFGCAALCWLPLNKVLTSRLSAAQISTTCETSSGPI